MTAPVHQSQQMDETLRHAPLPWRLAGKGTIRGDGNDSWVCSLHWRHRNGNAELLVEAVNSHEALKARIQELETALATYRDTNHVLRETLSVVRAGEMREALEWYAKDYDHVLGCSQWDGGAKARAALLQAPVTDARGKREKIARIISPMAFKALDNSYRVPSDSEFGQMQSARELADKIITALTVGVA
jgi:hypothetical protein